MTDPAVVPWVVVWFGLVLALCGMALAMHGVDHPKPKPPATVGAVSVVLGLVLMIAPPLVNGTVMLVRAFTQHAQGQATSGTDDNAYRQR